MSNKSISNGSDSNKDDQNNSANLQDKQDKQPANPTPPADLGNKDIVSREDYDKIFEENQRIKNNLSSTQKQNNEAKQTLEQLHKAFEVEKNRGKISRQLASDNSIPDKVKNTLLEELEEAEDLDIDSFNKKKERYVDLYNGGTEAIKSRTREEIGQAPSKTVPDDFDDKIGKATSIDELMNIAKNSL
jgi:hypothetical protein